MTSAGRGQRILWFPSYMADTLCQCGGAESDGIEWDVVKIMAFVHTFHKTLKFINSVLLGF